MKFLTYFISIYQIRLLVDKLHMQIYVCAKTNAARVHVASTCISSYPSFES